MKTDTQDYIYGINPAFEVVRANRREVICAYINDSTGHHPRLTILRNMLEKRRIEVRPADKGRLQNLCGSREHQNVVLLTSPYPYERFKDVLKFPILILLDNLQDPQNIGAIIRSAEVFGYPVVLLPRKGVPGIYPSTVKASAGATEHLFICQQYNSNQYFKKAADAGYKVVAMDAKGDQLFEDVLKERPEKLLLVIGGEDKSVGQYILNEADYVVRLKQSGQVSSLNASVAAGIALHEMMQ